MVLARKAIHLYVIAVWLPKLFTYLDKGVVIRASIPRQTVKPTAIGEFHAPDDAVVKGFGIWVGFCEPIDEFFNVVKACAFAITVLPA